MIKIKKLAIYEAKELSNLAVKAYNGSYLHIWKDDGLWYKSKMYSVEQHSIELANEANEFYFAIQDAIPCGYLKLQPNVSIKESDGEGFMIERIYFLKEYTGKGLGEELIQFAIKHAKDLKKDYVWLNAMDTSTSAIRFYEKLGFQIVSRYKLDYHRLKEGFEGMVTMKLTL